MYKPKNDRERFQDVWDSDKSWITKASTWDNLDRIRTITREHRETVHSLKIRCEKLEYQLTYILQQIQVLKERQSILEREKLDHVK